MFVLCLIFDYNRKRPKKANRFEFQQTTHKMYRTGQISDNYLLIAKTQRLTIVIKAVHRKREHDNTKSSFQAIIDYPEIKTENLLMQQYLSHCAILIQRKFRMYQQRKYYKKFLPVYRRLRELLMAVVLGWKVRRIFNIPSNKGKKQLIYKLEEQGKLMSMRILKRELTVDIGKSVKNGDWVKEGRKQILHKSKKQGIVTTVCIRNAFNQTIKFKPSKNKKQNSLQRTKRTEKNLSKQEEEIYQKIVPVVNEFDEKPIKSSFNKVDFQFDVIGQFEQKVERQMQKDKSATKPKKKGSKKVEKNKVEQQTLVPIGQRENEVSSIQNGSEKDNPKSQQQTSSCITPQTIQKPQKKQRLFVTSKFISLKQDLISRSEQQQFSQIPQNEQILKIQEYPNKGQSPPPTAKTIEIVLKAKPPQKQIFIQRGHPRRPSQSKKQIAGHLSVNQLLEVYEQNYDTKKRNLQKKMEEINSLKKKTAFSNSHQFFK